MSCTRTGQVWLLQCQPRESEVRSGQVIYDLMSQGRTLAFLVYEMGSNQRAMNRDVPLSDL